MNQRIESLLAKAHLEVMEDLGVIETNVVAEKFAELIVKECCDVLQTETIQHVGYGYNQGFLHKKIKDHFGVE